MTIQSYPFKIVNADTLRYLSFAPTKYRAIEQAIKFSYDKKIFITNEYDKPLAAYLHGKAVPIKG